MVLFKTKKHAQTEELNLLALDSGDDGPGSWGSYDEPDSWEVTNAILGL